MKRLVLLAVYLLGIFLPLLVPLKSQALSETVVIYQVQTRSAATDVDMVQLLNISSSPIDVAGWCVQYLPAAGNVTASAHSSCIPPETGMETRLLASYGSLTFATAAYVDSEVAVQLAGGLNHSGGHVRLLDKNKTEIDRVGWGTAAQPEGSALVVHSSSQRYRRLVDSFGIVVDSDQNMNDFALVELCLNLDGAELMAGWGKRTDGTCFIDFCPNIPDIQEAAPDGYEKPAGSTECVEIILEDSTLLITELYPNAPSTDDGNEYIELFNPNAKQVSLAGYRLQVGPSFTKEFVFVAGELQPQEYRVFSDSETGIVLPNSSGVQLRLVSPAGRTVSQTAVYENADEETSWSLINEAWQFTNQRTPNAANKPYVEAAQEEVLGATTVLAPCPPGKYRNPATNRCRTLETAVSALTPCDEDEYRNPDTNRCRKLASSSALAPCKEGQERNPETNRCRSVAVLGAAGPGELPTITDDASELLSSQQINWTVVSGVLLATFGYMVYEWRHELRQQFVRIRVARYNKA